MKWLFLCPILWLVGCSVVSAPFHKVSFHVGECVQLTEPTYKDKWENSRFPVIVKIAEIGIESYRGRYWCGELGYCSQDVALSFSSQSLFHLVECPK